MKRLLVGRGDNFDVFGQLDPDEPNEAEFELHVARALSRCYPRYCCVVFTGTFRYDDRGYRPDLALVARDGSHWFIIEVELVSHSLKRHVLPQVRSFRYGQPQEDCVTILARELAISRDRAQTLVALVPRSVVVVANKPNLTWRTALSGLDVQLASVSVYGGSNDHVAYEIDGTLNVMQESLGFGQYSAVDRSLLFPLSTRIPRGRVQIDDPAGGFAWWQASDGRSEVWLTKETGIPDMPNGAMIQLLRSYDGRLVFRRPG
ncbi:MAG: hypothetical protein HC927_03200 [Deltaproteobacteria bacterium]|nr:hypothetical protein [Deltaproteobacteria bacterium]